MVKREEIIKAVNELFNSYSGDWTIRQLYYRLVSPPYQLFANTRSKYNQYDRVMVEARENGLIDDDRIIDTTREISGGDGTDWSVKEYLDWCLSSLKSSAGDYPYPMWKKQHHFLVVALEKEALSRIVKEITREYRVALAINRGYASYTFVKKKVLPKFFGENKGKVNHILYLGDFDPSGLDMDKDLDKRLTRYSDEKIIFKRIGLLPEHIKSLPSNPTKKADTRAKEYVKEYGDACWELDALEPNKLQELVKSAISGYVDRDAWERDLKIWERRKKLVRQQIKKIFTLIEGK